jgi:hypothetical protein
MDSAWSPSRRRLRAAADGPWPVDIGVAAAVGLRRWRADALTFVATALAAGRGASGGGHLAHVRAPDPAALRVPRTGEVGGSQGPPARGAVADHLEGAAPGDEADGVMSGREPDHSELAAVDDANGARLRDARDRGVSPADVEALPLNPRRHARQCRPSPGGRRSSLSRPSPSGFGRVLAAPSGRLRDACSPCYTHVFCGGSRENVGPHGGPRQGGGHWFEPSIAHLSKPRPRRGFVVSVGPPRTKGGPFRRSDAGNQALGVRLVGAVAVAEDADQLSFLDVDAPQQRRQRQQGANGQSKPVAGSEAAPDHDQ